MAKGKKKEVLTLEEGLQAALVPESEQPYQVPGNWCWVKLNSICELERGITFPASAKESEPTSNNIPCLRTANIQDKLEIEDLIYVDKNYIKGNLSKLIRKDDIIMSSANSRELVGKTSYIYDVPYPMTFGGFLLAIRPKNILGKYVFYFLRLEFISGHFMGESTQTTNIANINTAKLGNCFIPIPPFSEQQRVVDRIESLFAKLDEARQKVQDVLDSFETRKAAILHKAFNGELTAQWRKAHGVEMKSWGRLPLKEVAEIGSGGTPSRKIKQYYLGNIPWIKTGEICWNYIYDSEEKISEKAIENSSAKLYPAGTVLVAMYGQGLTRGRAAIIKIDAATNQAVCALRPCDKLEARYLYYYFMANYWVYREKAVGGNQPNYSATMIGNWIIDVPSIFEQDEIIGILDDLITKEQQAREINEAVLEQIDLIKKSILARAFRGELGTNDPAEESTLELIKQTLSETIANNE